MKMSKANLPKPTEGELELLRVLWAKGSATVRELHDAVSQERELGYTTVLKLLQIMTEKGLVQRTEVGRAHAVSLLSRITTTQPQHPVPATEDGCPIISLVFREMWDTKVLDTQLYSRL